MLYKLFLLLHAYNHLGVVHASVSTLAYSKVSLKSVVWLILAIVDSLSHFFLGDIGERGHNDGLGSVKLCRQAVDHDLVD